MEDIEHPVRVARKPSWTTTPHVLLAGTGARDFALAHGFTTRDLLTANSKRAWEEWRKSAAYKPIINVENHDTIGMLAQDRDGRPRRRLYHERTGLQLARTRGRQPHHRRRTVRRRRSRSLHRHRAWAKP